MINIGSIGCLGLGTLVLFFTAMIFICRLESDIKKLRERIGDTNQEIRRHVKCLDNRIDKVEENFDVSMCAMKKEIEDKIEENIDASMNAMKNEIIESAKKEALHTPDLTGLEASLNGLLSVATEEHYQMSEWRSRAAERLTEPFGEHSDASEDSGDDDDPYADIPGDLDDGFEGEECGTDEQRKALLEYAENMLKSQNEAPSYRWVFPSEDHGENWPVLGAEYLVVGRERRTGEVVSGFGTWTGIKYDMDDGYKLDKIYAEIRLPSPSDVMDKVLDIHFKE